VFASYGPNFQEGVVMGLEKGVSAPRGMYSCELSSMLNTEENLGGVAITLRHSLFRNSTIGSTEKRCSTIGNTFKIPKISIGYLYFVIFLKCDPQKCSVCSELVRCYLL
jgi:hypothetical protein